jgi:hypothetical protein
MKLEASLISYIKNIVKTASSIGIDGIIIEQTVVRAMDEEKTVVMCQTANIPQLPFESLGINRINVFTDRLSLVENREGFEVTPIKSDRDDQIIALNMKATGIKVDYRCANIATISAPKQINDTIKYRVPLNAEAVALLARGQTAMGADTVTVISNDNGVAFELADTNNDVFSNIFTTNAEPVGDTVGVDFVNRYPVKTLLALFKQNPDGCFYIGQKGTLKINVNDIDIYVLPRV